MAKANKADNCLVICDDIANLLSAPLAADWTIDRLAEEVLSAVVQQRRPAGADTEEIVVDSNAIADRQSRRLLRPLLACLAQKSAAEAGTPPNLYKGRLTFKRSGGKGPVWILGDFENSPGAVRLKLRRTNSPPVDRKATINRHPLLVQADDASPTNASRPSATDHSA